MADYGLRVVNGSVVQIDGTYSNLALRAKGSVACTLSGTGSMLYGSAGIPGTTGVLAFKSAWPAVLFNYFVSGGGRNAQFGAFTVGTPGTPVVDWYLFDDPRNFVPPANERYGLRVKNASGAVTYDSRFPYLRHIGFIKGDVSMLPNTDHASTPNMANFFFPLGSVPAVLQGAVPWYSSEVPVGVGPNPGYMSVRSMCLFRQSASTLGGTMARYASGVYNTPNNEPETDRRKLFINVVDVAGL